MGRRYTAMRDFFRGVLRTSFLATSGFIAGPTSVVGGGSEIETERREVGGGRETMREIEVGRGRERN